MREPLQAILRGLWVSVSTPLLPNSQTVNLALGSVACALPNGYKRLQPSPPALNRCSSSPVTDLVDELFTDILMQPWTLKFRLPLHTPLYLQLCYVDSFVGRIHHNQYRHSLQLHVWIWAFKYAKVHHAPFRPQLMEKVNLIKCANDATPQLLLPSVALHH